VRRRVGRITFGARRPVATTLSAEAIAGTVGAVTPGVRRRRELERRELDVGDRIRRSLEARRGYSTGATFWRS
jgi:hypothetical protein